MFFENKRGHERTPRLKTKTTTESPLQGNHPDSQDDFGSFPRYPPPPRGGIFQPQTSPMTRRFSRKDYGLTSLTL